MSMAGKSGRTISAEPRGTVKKLLFSWESAMVLVFLGVILLGNVISPYYTLKNVFREMPKYLSEIFIMLAMGYILVLGDIDISVGSIVCLSATLACIADNAGLPFVLVVLICILTGLACGCLNGFIASHFTELPTMIITLGTQIIFRGIAEVSLGPGGSISLQNKDAIKLLSRKIGIIPVSFFVVLVFALIFIVVLGRTTFGRKLYAIGSNSTAAKYAGIDVQKIRWIVFTVAGTMAGVCALFFLASTYGASTTTGQGFEMEVIAMCVFGGIATTGGKGKLIGGFFAAFIIVCLRIALGQINMNTQLILVIIGAMLIVSVLIPAIGNALRLARKKAEKA